MNTKNILQSKTVWINVIALVFLLIQTMTGFIIKPEEQAALLVIINLVLRVITGEPLSIAGKTYYKK